MLTRLAWLAGVFTMVSIGFLMACGSHFSASSDGLLVVPSLGDDVVQSFIFNLASGHVSAINKPPVLSTPPTAQGAPTSVVLDPSGSFAYVTSTHVTSPGTDPCASSNAIATFKINSDGTLSTIGSQGVGTNPAVALAIDSAGKFLFAASTATCSQTGTVIGPGYVSVFSIGSNASLTKVPGSPFSLPQAAGTGVPNPLALAVTHTVFPAAGTPAACTSLPVPTVEYLYVADATGNDVVGFSISSSGSLTPIPVTLPAVGFATGNTPSGVAVDPCNRFVYVTNQASNTVSVYNICSKVGLGNCTINDWSLVPVTGSPFSAGTSPGPLVVDPFGKFLYVLDTGQSAISLYRIAQSTGALTPLSPATVGVGSSPVSIAIRGDDNWLFVANYVSATVSQFVVTPATGALTPVGTGIVTDNFPWGVAVK
jgi:6-phosphogluconolactonase (cycloisomerase 2 family)